LIHKKNRKREQLEGERKNLAELQELYPTSQALLLERAFLEKELRNGNEGCRLLGLFCQKNQEELSSHYLLSLWQLSRGDYEKSWTTWHQLEKVCGERHPPCLEELRLELLRHSADPSPSKLLTPNPHDEPHIHETR